MVGCRGRQPVAGVNGCVACSTQRAIKQPRVVGRSDGAASALANHAVPEILAAGPPDIGNHTCTQLVGGLTTELSVEDIAQVCRN